jgi:3-isopropylmalate/(R)-2-methylmalate dehydratase small subunit
VFEIDLAAQTVIAPSGLTLSFDIEPGAKRRLMEGLDDIALTLRRLPEVEAFERGRVQSDR